MAHSTSQVRGYGAALQAEPEQVETRELRIPDEGQAPETRRQLRGSSSTDRLNISGSAACGLCVALLLFGRIAPFSGILGFAVVTYSVFLASYTVLASMTEEGPAIRDKLITVILYSVAGISFAALGLVVVFTIARGRSALFRLNFFTQDMSKAGPLTPLNVGGVKHALFGTIWMIGIASVLTIPLGIAGAVYMNESPGRFSRLVRTVVDAMTALPSIVAGLFIYATWILTFHHDSSGLAAAMAISLMMLPIIIRASDVVLRLVPGNLKEASAALGAPSWRTVWHVILPTARSGLATAVILGIARGIGETAPVLLTAGSTAHLNNNPTHGPMVSLPLAAFEFVRNSQKTFIARGFAAAAFLMILVLILFVVARVLGGRGPGYVSTRQARRATRRSEADRARFDRRSSGADLSLADPGGTIR